MQNNLTAITPGMMLGVYRTMELIGKGGFSEVWSAWDTRLQRMVAVKILPHENIDPDNLLHFNREALIITKLEHPHILPLYDFGEEQAHHFLVMRYLTGGSLSAKLQGGTIPPAEVLRLMTPIALALDYLHANQIVHRDIKSGNILLDVQGSPYLTDFGLAKSLSDETRQMNSGSGTLHFMSPEQLNSEAITTQSDQYSFGILLFQLFTGELPLNGDYVFSMRQAHMGETLPNVTVINPKLPEGLNEPLRRLTALKPEDRPRSLVAAMEQIAVLFKDKADIPAAPPSIVAMPDSREYHKQEAASLLEKALPAWYDGKFTLSLTHFVLLDIFLDELPDLITSDVRSLMLRGAFDEGQKIEKWWDKSTDPERRGACWNALDGNNDAVHLRVLKLVAKAKWQESISSKVFHQISNRLMPVSDFTPIVLEILERALPVQKEWRIEKPELPGVDDGLRQLVLSHSTLSRRAAALIGKTHRLKAAEGLPADLKHAEPLLAILENAGSLPPGYSTSDSIRLALWLGVHQLTRQPLIAFRKYLWAIAGGMFSVALMVYIIYRKLTLVDTVPFLNAIGQGIMFGILYGSGIWLARHISEQLQVAPRWLRVGIGTIAGGLVLAAGFWLYQRLVYDDEILLMVSIPAGLVYVFGFAVSTGLRARLQILAGTAGFVAAFLIPWSVYLNSEGSIRPPFFFDESAPVTAVGMVLAAGILLSALVTGYLWLLPILRKALTAQPATGKV